MYSSSIQTLTIRISFLISFLAAVVFFIFIDLSAPFNVIASCLFLLFLFLLTYLIFKYTIEKVVQNKLSIIYKTIHELKRGEVEMQLNSKADKALSEVQDEVTDWYLDNKKELDRLTILETYRRDFIGNVSHELKTPVFNIQGYLLTLLEGGLEDKSINRKYLERAEKSVEKLIKLLKELDMIIRLDTGMVELDLKKVDIVDLAKEVKDALDLKADQRKIQIKINRKNLQPIFVRIDEDKITQVLTNLVHNSIKYGKEKGTIVLSFHDLKDKILVEIKDDGIGMKKSELERIFDRFYRTDTARGHNTKGTGLGLSIVKHIIEAHKETIHVNSDEGKGSTFSFTLKKA